MTERRVSMPVALTAENGAKAALIGEFKEEIELDCPDCFGDDSEQCETCDNAGVIWHSVPVEWTTIKAIYAKAVELLAQESEG